MQLMNLQTQIVWRKFTQFDFYVNLLQKKKSKNNYSDDDYEEEDVKPKKAAKKAPPKKAAKKAPLPPPKKSSSAKKAPPPPTPTKAGGRKKKEEPEQKVWKWWEEEKKDDGTKWKFLQHKGPLFAPLYERMPEYVNFYYEGKIILQVAKQVWRGFNLERDEFFNKLKLPEFYMSKSEFSCSF